jgi:hypothetical protein
MGLGFLAFLHQKIQNLEVDNQELWSEIQELRHEQEARLMTILDWETRSRIAQGEGFIHVSDIFNCLLTCPTSSVERRVRSEVLDSTRSICPSRKERVQIS